MENIIPIAASLVLVVLLIIGIVRYNSRMKKIAFEKGLTKGSIAQVKVRGVYYTIYVTDISESNFIGTDIHDGKKIVQAVYSEFIKII